MKQVFHKILSLSMTFVVLFSTMSFTVNMHYCGNILIETTIFHKVEGCGMEMENTSTEGCTITNKNCCNDKQLLVDGQDELQLQVDSIFYERHVFLASFVHTYINLYEGSDNNLSFYKAYKPPLVTRQLFKLDETYLI